MPDDQSQMVLFGDRFLDDHAGQIIHDPQIALVELVANAYDAGATRVEITWPEQRGDRFEVTDNGTGMTPDEFERRWKTLSYSRLQEQGPQVGFPQGARKKSNRMAFGRNGKGRHAAFCFTDTYSVETWRDGTAVTAKVEWTRGGKTPFSFPEQRRSQKTGHGTRIWGTVDRNLAEPDRLTETIGSKFIVDPSFTVILNKRQLELTGLQYLTTTTLPINGQGEVTIHRIDAPSQDRTTRLRGITWWVNKRMVGQPSWDGLDDRGAILDGRKQAAKRHSFVIEADLLHEDAKDDWTGFHDSPDSIAVREAVRQHVSEELDKILSEARRERKMEALAEQRDALQQLPVISQKVVGEFVDELQKQCPLLTDRELASTASVFTKFEQARSGYDLLHRLATASPHDIDTWNDIMRDWTAVNAKVVLAELKKRLDLIEELQDLVNDKKTDELHQLQPLFARGLWVFGPEYESPDFVSNRAMATAVGKLLGGTEDSLSSRRPDFVVLPGRSVGVYAADRFDDEGEAAGVRKVLVIELKRDGSTLTYDEVMQGGRYPHELRKGNHVEKDTSFRVFVLGAKVGDDATTTEANDGKVRVEPWTYNRILKRAHARTFHLHNRLKDVEPVDENDPEVKAVVEIASPAASADQEANLFEEVSSNGSPDAEAN